VSAKARAIIKRFIGKRLEHVRGMVVPVAPVRETLAAEASGNPSGVRAQPWSRSAENSQFALSLKRPPVPIVDGKADFGVEQLIFASSPTARGAPARSAGAGLAPIHHRRAGLG